MSLATSIRGAALTLMLLGIPAAAVSVPVASTAQAQDVDFRLALEPYGQWRNDPRFGEVWLPAKPRGWRPYTVGHWVYTEEWGWYWISEDDEEDWGWLAFHYGRWVFLRGAGWAWLPGDEWAPAWVNWRDSADYVGWSPLPPDDLIEEYDDGPEYWTFLPPRYLVVSRPYRFYAPPGRRSALLRSTVLVNRTLRAGTDAHLAVNPGIAPTRIAAVSRSALPTFRVRPRVLPGTQGIANAITVQRTDIGRRPAGAQQGPRANAVTVQRAAAVQPAATATPVQPLAKGERGRLGSHPPRAAQGGATAPASPPAPATAPATPPSAPAVTAPQRPSAPPVTPQRPAEPPRSGPPSANPNRSSEPQGRPARPIAPQAPPPATARPSPPPAAAPPAARPAPPAARPAPPPPRPAAPPPPPAAAPKPAAPPPAAPPPAAPPPAKKPPPPAPPKPGEKPGEKPAEEKK